MGQERIARVSKKIRSDYRSASRNKLTQLFAKSLIDHIEHRKDQKFIFIKRIFRRDYVQIGSGPCKRFVMHIGSVDYLLMFAQARRMRETAQRLGVSMTIAAWVRMREPAIG